MLLTPIKKDDSLRELPFYHLLVTDDVDVMTYLIRKREEIIGFVRLDEVDLDTYKLVKFVMNRPENSEELIEIFYHLLEAVDQIKAQHLLVETNKRPLIELLGWLGFKAWPQEKNCYGYSFS